MGGECETCGQGKNAFCCCELFVIACAHCEEIVRDVREEHTPALTEADVTFLWKMGVAPLAIERAPVKRWTADDLEFLRAVGITPEIPFFEPPPSGTA